MSTLTPEAQRVLYAETDARFWAQMGYKPGQKLDPKNPIDAKMIPTYTNIYNKVLGEWKAGKLVATYDHPIVVALVQEAKDLTSGAAAHMDAVVTAIAENASQKAQEHLAAAHEHRAAAQAKTAEAATHQPPTVSHPHAAHAAHQVTQFVMNGAGQGVPVSNGSDAVAAMQAAAAPDQIAAAPASPDGQSDILAQARELALQRAQEHAPTKNTSAGFVVAICASAVAALGLLTLAIKGPTLVRGRPSPGYRRSFQARSRRSA